MKTRKLPLILIAFLAVGLTNCKKKAGPLSCASDTVKYSENLSAFIADQSKGNCEAVKSSILSLYGSCTAIAGLDKEAYDEFENEFDCSDI